MIKHATSWLAVLAVVASSAVPATYADAREAKVKYAKSEVDRAVGKCVGSVIGGALLGALVGGIIGGKRGTGVGAAAGAGAGAAYCAVLISNAKRKDRIIAAQIAAGAYTNQTYTTEFGDDNGQVMHFSGSASPSRQIDSAALLPVKYKTESGEVMASPVLDTGGQECRSVNSSLSGAGNSGALPVQIVCRTSEGNWQPYGLKLA
jgi:hypothetical protein